MDSFEQNQGKSDDTIGNNPSKDSTKTGGANFTVKEDAKKYA